MGHSAVGVKDKRDEEGPGFLGVASWQKKEFAMYLAQWVKIRSVCLLVPFRETVRWVRAGYCSCK